MKAAKTKCRMCDTRTCSPDGLCCDHRRTVPRECGKCRRMMPIKAKGICAKCYDTLVACARCGIARKIQRNGVCCACIKRGNLDVPYTEFDPEPTQEELDRTIAEQSAKLPRWWENSVALAKKEPRSPSIRVIRTKDFGGKIIKRKPDLW